MKDKYELYRRSVEYYLDNVYKKFIIDEYETPNKFYY
jgi:hypothetical protein